MGVTNNEVSEDNVPENLFGHQRDCKSKHFLVLAVPVAVVLLNPQALPKFDSWLRLRLWVWLRLWRLWPWWHAREHVLLAIVAVAMAVAVAVAVAVGLGCGRQGLDSGVDLLQGARHGFYVRGGVFLDVRVRHCHVEAESMDPHAVDVQGRAHNLLETFALN